MCSLTDLFAAGSETTSTTLLWSFLFMLENPDVLKKVREEINDNVSADQLVRLNDKSDTYFILLTLFCV